MKLEVNGIQYENFIESTARVSMQDFGSSFTFIAAASNANRLPFKGGESCKVIIEGEKVITGTIEVVDIDWDSKSHVIVVSGRGRCADFADSYIDNISDLSAANTLVDVIQKVVDSIPDLNLKVKTNVAQSSFNKAEDLLSPAVSENCFDYADSVCRRKQVLITEDVNGDILLTRSSNDVYPDLIKQVVGADDNNILSAKATYDYSGIFRTYKVKSQSNPTTMTLGGKFGVKDIVGNDGLYVDVRNRKGRQFVVVSEQSASNLTAQERAKWEADIRRTRSIKYQATVQGYKNGSEIWYPNKLVKIIDELCNIDSTMLLVDVEYSSKIEEGTKSILTFVEKGSFTLELSNIPQRGEKNGNDFASKFN
jgi:prophage tail gpP-like protein